MCVCTSLFRLCTLVQCVCVPVHDRRAGSGVAAQDAFVDVVGSNLPALLIG